MQRRSRSIRRIFLFSILWILAAGFGWNTVAGAETVAELEKKAADCRKALAWAIELRARNSCDSVLSTPVEKDDNVQFYADLRTTNARYVSGLESYIDTSNREIEHLEVRCNAALRAGELSPPVCAERDQARAYRKEALESYRKAQTEQRRLNNKYREAVNEANKLRAECKALKKQIADGEKTCTAIEKRLLAARTPPPPPPQPQRQSPHPGTPTNFRVECNPTQVQVGGTVTCTAHGIFGYSSNYMNNIDLTNDPETVWQNGPRVSATGLKPGQTFVVRATKGNISDGVTITVVGAKQAATGRTIKVGFINYQKIPGLTITVSGMSKSCSGGSGGVSWSNTNPQSTQGTAECVFEIPAGSHEVTAQASGYQTQTFRQTYDKDQNYMITMTKSQ
jgi:hypothetical protein